ncbi:MAG: WecB/TagA/CpsF family glycosyltransferase, partial [Nanoarchaeota archaeon]
MKKVEILGVLVDKIEKKEAISRIEGWIRTKKGKHYIVTPNIEFIIASKRDSEFRKILNRADLAIADSSRLGWADFQLNSENYITKILTWPLFILPRFFKFPVLTGVDLMEELISISNEKGYTIGLIGGKNNLAEKLKKCLLTKYPDLKVVFANSDIEVNNLGDTTYKIDSEKISSTKAKENAQNITKDIDILFVAFGQIKQEKWIYKNLPKLNTKIMMGVGGAFDYLSGEVTRAPWILRTLGFEWLFRLIIQPWRITRFGSLVEFIFLVLFNKNKYFALLIIPPFVLAIVAYYLNYRFDLSSVDERFVIWKDTIRGLTLFGHGVGSYEITFS